MAVFYADTRFPGSPDLLDYHNSINDRGYMAPTADQPTEQEQAETYALTNIVLQTASLNEGIWTRVERRMRSIDLYVVTDPTFHLKLV